MVILARCLIKNCANSIVIPLFETVCTVVNVSNIYIRVEVSIS